MKLRNLLFLSALAIAGMGCSNDPIDGETPVRGAANELQLVIGGNGEGVDYTKAIASESENKIDNLDVYLFASDAEGGTYRYMEKWQSGAANDKDAKTFVLQPSGSEWNASIFPADIAGYPYLKLLLVANRENNLYQENGADPLATLKPFTDAAGFDAATTEAAFLQSYTKALETESVLTPSLLMSGSNKTKILGTVSKVKIELKRAVARFDIDNTARTSNLTIESIALKQGRKTAPLWPEGTLTLVADDNLGTSDFLMEYKQVAYTDLPNANQGVTESAIYVYPTLATDKAELIIKGKYYNPATNTKMEATYNVPLQKTNEAGTAEQIAINRNSRYKLRIIDVTTTTMAATFEIEDWTSGGGISIKPENSAPYYTLETLFGTTPDSDKPGGPYPIFAPATGFRVSEDKTFDIVMAATGRTSVEKSLAEPLTKAAAMGDPDWLTIAPSQNEDYVVKDGITYTTFHITTDADMTEAHPVSLRFTNEAASLDPDLQPVLTFYSWRSNVPPYLYETTGHSAGNSIDCTDKAAATATMTKANGSMIKIKVSDFEGCAFDTPAGFSIEKVGHENMYSIYEVKIIDTEQVEGSPVTITWQDADKNLTGSTLTITVNE